MAWQGAKTWEGGEGGGVNHLQPTTGCPASAEERRPLERLLGPPCMQIAIFASLAADISAKGFCSGSLDESNKPPSDRFEMVAWSPARSLAAASEKGREYIVELNPARESVSSASGSVRAARLLTCRLGLQHFCPELP